MHKILWIGSPFFQAALPACGWHVHFCNFEEVTTFTWECLVEKAGFEPDVLVMADKSRPPFLLGVEDFPCFTVFYAVDTHIHSWYPYYAQVFDACLVSLKDHIPHFHNKTLPPQHILWSPPFARDTDAPRLDISPLWDCLFVGTIHAQNTPQRKAFLEEVQQQLPQLHCTRGNYAELFPQGRIILNQCEHEDLNFRVFEALGCGACLLTPRIGHGLTELFSERKELFCYNSHDVKEVVSVIRSLLEQDDLRKNVAAQGLATIDNGHRARHRALAFTKFLEGFSPQYKQKCVQQRRTHAHALRETYLKPLFLLLAEAIEDEHLRKTYLLASRGIFPQTAHGKR